MATVFRVQKTKDFTVMSNHHLKNKDLSLRSKGLLSFMLSLPEDWDYSLKGLATLNKEGIDAIRSAINELEAFGYIERSRVRNEKGQLGENEYIIHELPISPEPKQTSSTSTPVIRASGARWAIIRAISPVPVPTSRMRRSEGRTPAHAPSSTPSVPTFIGQRS